MNVADLNLQTSLPIQVAATPSNFGRYDPFLYKDWRYPLDARNKAENKGKEDVRGDIPWASTETATMIGKRQRLVEPDYLCFVSPDEKVQLAKVSDWTKDNGRMTTTDYVFISFTGKHYPPNNNNRNYLKHVGIAAAREAGVSAYWISQSCLFDIHESDEQTRQHQKEQTIWNMSDIIRRAKAIAVAIPGYRDSDYNSDSLKEWGSRLWTMPELLLYTGHDDILVYDQNLDEPWQIPRRELWNKAWNDTAFSGQLIDHYEGSLILTPLELCTVALHCLQNRENGTTYLDGDLAYVLMGLLRQRPEIVATDSAFQAFARLSLANDSNSLLERMICLLPKRLDSEWWVLDDAWNVALWDIYPKTQICGLGDHDSVILDGARGAAIRWDEFIPVRTLGEETMRHKLVRWSVRSMPALFLGGIVWTAIAAAAGTNVVLIFGAILLSVSCIIMLALPYLLRMIYCTKTRHCQPLFFGIEGHVEIRQLELLIFGSYEGRLQWGTTSSPLSRHGPDKINKTLADSIPNFEEYSKEQNLYRGLDPKQPDSRVEKLIEEAEDGISADNDQQQNTRIFTLVDTYTMTVTLFEARRPPIAVIVCGAEGGMQRALLCSEDWRTGIMYRETVLRMETRVWDKMDTLPRIRLGLKGRE